jgi:hypothetical protein
MAPRDQLLHRLRQETLTRLATPHPKDYWLHQAEQEVNSALELRRMFPSHQPHPACILEATLEWKRLIENDLTDQASCEPLFSRASENCRHNMHWIAFSELLASWMYSHGHARALKLSHYLSGIESWLQDAPSDA